MKKTRNPLRSLVWSLATAFVLSSSASWAETLVPLKSRVVLTSQVKFDKLNPARGELSPKAGTLWGDRSGQQATGFLFHPVDGFSSPPHIHNITYRGVVIRGVVHNDDPEAGNIWMPAGSFWTQPKGHVHITSAQGADTLAYIEIEEGPYLVLPTQERFQSGEVPVNVDVSNLVWAKHNGCSSKARIAYLWGEPEQGKLNGTLLKIAKGSTTVIRSQDSNFRAVVIQGQPDYRKPDTGQIVTLEPGSLFMANAAANHKISADPESDLVLYIRSNGNYELLSSEENQRNIPR